MVELLEHELLGPASADELIDESPLSRYLVGALAPFGTDVPVEEQEDSPGEDEGEDFVGAPEYAPPLSQALSPSSIGLSCMLSRNIERLRVEVSWGEYERVSGSSAKSAVTDSVSEDDDEAEGEDDSEAKRRPRERWRRTPVAAEIELVIKPNEGLVQERLEAPDDIWVEHIARPIDDDSITLSVFLVNRRPYSDPGRPPADRWIFQPQLAVTDVNGAAIFSPRELEPEIVRTDRDLESNALLYRHRREFAIGHGCAVKWSPVEGALASEVCTDLIPHIELPKVSPKEIPGASLDMDALSKVRSGEELKGHLNPLADAYAAWIHSKRQEVAGLDPNLTATAEDHLKSAEESLSRIRDGIELIATEDGARRAFMFANHAMLLQRGQTEWARQRRAEPESAPNQPTLSGKWRPFQLAFILQNLRGIANPGHPDRSIGDLLWFPTGGGKTEAYLGLAAFTLAMRRLREDTLRTDAGMAVLMRYTLRLLTIQQFQRASTLICACEFLRRSEPDVWGRERFSIGLWLGKQATPNKHSASRLALDRLRAGEPQDDDNPCQLENCPWCGESLDHEDYEANSDRFRTIVRCPRVGCEFGASEGAELPVVLVDEEIYRECPSMLIATVDKFAQMPWNGEVAALFGNVTKECRRCGFLTPSSDHPPNHKKSGLESKAGAAVLDTPRLAPPELIIQDELHLISGPLGTMVGLYETAVDALCTRIVEGEQIRPKVIASTATIRRAFDQVRALFARDLKVFPPLGLEPDDSFFAFETEIGDESPGRLYVGVMAPGKSMKTALVRVSAALLSAGSGLKSADAELADPYLTLVAYFNSLRELGGAVRLMEDDIPARLRQLANRDLPKRNRPFYQELTSRVHSEKIPGLLRQLETAHNAPSVEGEPSLDAVLASSMIGVGVDVDRLGLMSVLGQPKTTAEYIQATSRVGRQSRGPGLVVTIYNWVRPRDISHYERFRHYHSTLYRHVEAVSATPFSLRAMDRGLAGAFVALSRLESEELNAEDAASKYDTANPSIEDVIRAFGRRAAQTADKQASKEIEEAIRSYVDRWGEYARSSLHYGYRRPVDDGKEPDFGVLLKAAEGGKHGHWRAPGSLREVEETSSVYVNNFENRGR